MDGVTSAGAAALFIPLMVPSGRQATVASVGDASRLNIGVSFCARPNIVSRTQRRTSPEETDLEECFVLSRTPSYGK